MNFWDILLCKTLFGVHFGTSIICGIIGTLVVTNRMVFVAGGIAHSVYGGVGIAAFFGLPILVGATGFSIFCAILLAYMLLFAKNVWILLSAHYGLLVWH